MSKRKKTTLVLGYSDSEYEDDDYEDMNEDQQSDQAEESNHSDIECDNSNSNPNEGETKETGAFFEDIFGDKDMSITEFNRSLFGKSPDELRIPPISHFSKCSEELQNQVKTLYEKVVMKDYDMNKAIQARKAMRNPSIYEKMISYCHINEMATNYPKEIHDPEPFLSKDSFYEELSKVQKDEMEKRAREKKENQEEKKNPNISSLTSTATERKSKWDSASTTTTTTTTPSAAIAAALAAANKVKHLSSLSSSSTSSSTISMTSQVKTKSSSFNKPPVISLKGTASRKKAKK